MTITKRQSIFIEQLFELYKDAKNPVHYSVIAEKLSVSPFTAYDMLRRLEKKGIVKAEYRLTSDKSAPGRTEVVFLPTEKAHRLMAELTDPTSTPDWETVKDQALTKVLDLAQKEDLTEEVMAHMPPETTEGVMGYCLEIMTVIALRLKRGAGRDLVREYLPIILPQVDMANVTNLSLLGGFALGILVSENAADRLWCHQLFEHIQRYETLINDMPPEMHASLATKLAEVYMAF